MWVSVLRRISLLLTQAGCKNRIWHRQILATHSTTGKLLKREIISDGLFHFWQIIFFVEDRQFSIHYFLTIWFLVKTKKEFIANVFRLWHINLVLQMRFAHVPQLVSVESLQLQEKVNWTNVHVWPNRLPTALAFVPPLGHCGYRQAFLTMAGIEFHSIDNISELQQKPFLSSSYYLSILFGNIVCVVYIYMGLLLFLKAIYHSTLL